MLKNMSIFRVVCLMIFSLTASFVQAGAPDGPTNLRVNNVDCPVGTEEKVFFGWFVNDADDNEIQSAYQILVASSEYKINADKGDIWDSWKGVWKKAELCNLQWKEA